MATCLPTIRCAPKCSILLNSIFAKTFINVQTIRIIIKSNFMVNEFYALSAAAMIATTTATNEQMSSAVQYLYLKRSQYTFISNYHSWLWRYCCFTDIYQATWSFDFCMKNFWVNGEPITHYELIMMETGEKQKNTNAQPFQHLLTVIYSISFRECAKEPNESVRQRRKNQRNTGISFMKL